MTPLLYAKIGAAALIIAVLFGSGYHLGGMASRTALEADHAAMAKATTDALLAQRAAQEAQAINDHATEMNYAHTIVKIDAAPAIRTPILVCDPSPVRAGTLPGAEAQTGGSPADPAGGRGEPVDRTRDIRPGVESLKRQLEKIMAGYRQLDAEWAK